MSNLENKMKALKNYIKSLKMRSITIKPMIVNPNRKASLLFMNDYKFVIMSNYLNEDKYKDRLALLKEYITQNFDSNRGVFEDSDEFYFLIR